MEALTRQAQFWKPMDGGSVQCLLCPHLCRIKDGATGICGVRRCQDGKLYTENYGRVASVALDPIEKKPLYHFHPGEFILSAGTVGCNLSCLFCQNRSISKQVATPTEAITPAGLVRLAKERRSFGIAYTYNEPFIWYEFVKEAAALARQAGLANVLVTNGFVSPEPLKELLPFIDAANIDLKSIRDKFYQEVCGGRLKPVLETIKTMASTCHVELTNLVIPTLNDSEEDLGALVDWVFENLGPDVPLHFSRYFPCYKMTQPPTPVETLRRAGVIARRKLKNVHLGNIG
jgi:pyruvate formate lyase activating enzyme